MAQFSRWFFPQTGNSSFYCKYNNKTLQVRQTVGSEIPTFHATMPVQCVRPQLYRLKGVTMPHLTWHVLQAYSAIMHFSGALASIPASYFTQHWGRKGYVNCENYTLLFCSPHPTHALTCVRPARRSMIIAGTSFLIGAVFQASAKSTIALLFIGRVFWGVGKCTIILSVLSIVLKLVYLAQILPLCTGVGFGDHCAFIYTAEMAPPRYVLDTVLLKDF